MNQNLQDNNDLSNMLTKNKERRMNEKSVDDILNSIDNKNKPSHISARQEADDVKQYNPAPQIAASESGNEATKLISVNEKPQKKPLAASSGDDEARRERLRRKRKAEKRQQYRIKQSRKTALGIFLGVLLSVCIIGVSAYLGILALKTALDFTGIANSEFEVQVEIPENATSHEVAQILADKGIIKMPDFFETYSEKTGADGKYVAGTYTLSSAMSYSRIVTVLQPKSTSARQTVEVRIVEGMTASEIGRLLEENFVCKAEDFMKFYKDKLNVYSFEKRVNDEPLKFCQLEGYLYPDTYDFYIVNELQKDPDLIVDESTEEGKELKKELEDAAEIAAQKIYSNFNSKITKLMYKQMNEMGLTLDDLITLASMVQKEAGTVEDMSLVASVFMNRLHDSERFPRLESDVTHFYVRDEIKPNYSTVNPSASLNAISDAYDTYTAIGIPAGPICNPGMDAIQAVLNYEQTNYYYFCANEETGETFYATTIEEHEKNLVLAGIKSE